jgi:hypothetical protein
LKLLRAETLQARTRHSRLCGTREYALVEGLRETGDDDEIEPGFMLGILQDLLVARVEEQLRECGTGIGARRFATA